VFLSLPISFDFRIAKLGKLSVLAVDVEKSFIIFNYQLKSRILRHEKIKVGRIGSDFGGGI